MPKSQDPDFSAALLLVNDALKARLDVLEKSQVLFLPRPTRPQAASAAASPIPAPKGAESGDSPLDEALVALSKKGLSAPQSLAALQNEILGACTRCQLHGGRKNIVFGVGNPRAEVVFVGEGPGAEEDRLGEPFVGRAGQLLTKMIQGGMGYQREEVYICNVVKCRPPNNRDPEPEEVQSCEPFLKSQLSIIQPKVIITLGRYASQCLLRTKAPMGRLRGRWASYQGVDVMPTFHPAYLLRSPEKKREVWEDLKAVMRKLGRPIPGRDQG